MESNWIFDLGSTIFLRKLKRSCTKCKVVTPVRGTKWVGCIFLQIYYRQLQKITKNLIIFRIMASRYELGNFVTAETQRRLELNVQKPSLTIEREDSRYAFYLGNAGESKTLVIALHERITGKLRNYKYIGTVEETALATQENREIQLLSVIKRRNRVSLAAIEPTLRRYIPGITRALIREHVPRIYTPITGYSEDGLGPHEKK